MNKIITAMVLLTCFILSACAAVNLAGRQDVIRGEGEHDVMVLIPAGKFTMGSSAEDEKLGIIVGNNEQPRHEVKLKAFYIDIYEVTNLQYQRFIDATDNKTPYDYKDRKYPEGEGYLPVSHIDWYDANAYCKWVGKRLPTEAEWEKAARGTDARIYPWGDEYDLNKLNTREWNKRKVERVTVGSFSEGVSPYGVFDMAGSVWEWTEDWYAPYLGNTMKSTNYGEKLKVARGGGWNSEGHDLARTATRFPYIPNKAYHCFIGVRCVKDIK